MSIFVSDRIINKDIIDILYDIQSSCRNGKLRTIEERRQSLLEKRGREPTEAQLKGWREEIDIYSKMKQEEIII